MLYLEKRNFEDEVLKRAQNEIVSAHIETLILVRLRKVRLSGYDLLKMIRVDFNLLVSPGTMYSALYSLERKGYIVCSVNGRRRTCTLTEKGETLLQILTESKRLRILLNKLTKELFVDNAENRFLKVNGSERSSEAQQCSDSIFVCH
jgi:DNA-binding PadR family transcriptional regulator